MAQAWKKLQLMTKKTYVSVHESQTKELEQQVLDLQHSKERALQDLNHQLEEVRREKFGSSHSSNRTRMVFGKQ